MAHQYHKLTNIITIVLLTIFGNSLVAGELVGVPLKGEYVGPTDSISEFSPEEKTLDLQKAPLPVIQKALADELANKDPMEMVRVIITLDHQPQLAVKREIVSRHKAEINQIQKQIRSISSLYTENRNNEADVDAKNFNRNILDLALEDQMALKEAQLQHEALSLTIKSEIASRLRSDITADQASVNKAIADMGGVAEFGTLAINAIIASVPVGVVERLAAVDKVSRISADMLMESHLTTADESTLVTAPLLTGGGLRDNGQCGGIYDPAVLDTGSDLGHPFLQNSVTPLRDNFYSWYLVAGAANADFDDVISEDDMQGHGSHVMGIVASLGSGIYPNHLGMANCVEKAVTLKAGWRRLSNGRGAMYASDAMNLVDRALYVTANLQPFGTFNDDVEGINLSFGGSTATDETAYSRFYDSIVATYPDLIVTLSAGNSGPGGTTLGSPSTSFNAITVASVDDLNTTSRDDDIIASYSSRGPTVGLRRKPDISAPGSNIQSANNNWETEIDWISKSGTSMAAPMILGIAMDLMDAGVFDELQIKALLLNHAQKNEPGINFEADADGWSTAYGWGYVNAWSSYYHRDDVRTETVTPNGIAGDYVLYKGTMRDEGVSGEGRDRATIVWNREAVYNTAAYPTTYYGLTDLNLRLYAESNNSVIDWDLTGPDNVQQVRIGAGAGATDVVVKAYAWSSVFAHGGATEEFALATEENFVKVDLPASFGGIGAWPTEMEPNEERDFTFWLRNNSDIASHTNQFDLILPANWTLISGPDPYAAGSIAGGGGLSGQVTWRLRAPPTAVGAQSIQSGHSHNSYAEAWGPFNWSMGVNVAVDVTPPSPSPMTWVTEPYELSTTSIGMRSTTATDIHGPIEYTFFASPLTGGPGATTSAWQTSTTYIDSGLGANHQYRYWVRARDAATTPNYTAWSAYSDEYTSIETPTGINFGAITNSSIQVQSTNTPSNLTFGTSGLILFNVTAATTPGWVQNNNFWTSALLSTNTQYSFRARARNGDSALTAYGPTVARFTLANNPAAAAFSNITETSIRANWAANGNPAITQYYGQNITNGTGSGWSTALTWNSTGLTCGTTYSFRVLARNGDGVASSWVSLGTQATAACPDKDGDGVPDFKDNCTLIPNPDQRDTNGDGYGNICDPDLNNDVIVNFLDLGIMRSLLFTGDPDADLNGDGSVNFIDLGIMRSMLFQPPGPSGLAP